jgi:hypothetical protein
MINVAHTVKQRNWTKKTTNNHIDETQNLLPLLRLAIECTKAPSTICEQGAGKTQSLKKGLTSFGSLLFVCFTVVGSHTFFSAGSPHCGVGSFRAMAPTKPPQRVNLCNDDNDADASEVEDQKRKERQERFSASGGSRSEASSHATAAPKASNELPKVPKKDSSRKNFSQKEQSEAMDKARRAEKEKGRGGASLGNQKFHRLSDAENHPLPDTTVIDANDDEDMEFVPSNSDPSS